MILCQFIFKPGVYDAEFHELDDQIAAYARILPGFRGVETWQSADGTIVNASYYFDEMSSVKELSRFSEHRKAKGRYRRWYDGYQIVVSAVTRSYGDGRLPHITAQEQA